MQKNPLKSKLSNKKIGKGKLDPQDTEIKKTLRIFTFEIYSIIMHNARYDVTHGKGIKILTAKVYRNRTNSIKLEYKMDTIFMNSENSETSDPQTIIQVFGQKNVKKIYIYIYMLFHQILASSIHGEI